MSEGYDVPRIYIIELAIVIKHNFNLSFTKASRKLNIRDIRFSLVNGHHTTKTCPCNIQRFLKF